MSSSNAWDELSESSKFAISYAYFLEWPADQPMESAAEDVEPVTTEAILFGILHSHTATTGELNMLLEFAGISGDQLLEGVNGERRSRGLAEVRDDARDVSSLSTMPPLTTKAEALIEEARELTRNYNATEGLVRLQDLFGGLLRTPTSVAYEGLARAFGSSAVQFPQVIETYTSFLAVSHKSTYREFLQQVFGTPSLADEESRMEQQTSAKSPDSSPPKQEPLERPWDTAMSKANRDAPASVDKLGFAPLTRGLAATVTHEQTELPMAIAVTAPWGAGKSSLMLQLQSELRAYNKRKPETGNVSAGAGGKRRRWFTVEFPAWKYQQTERVWAAMAKAIYQQPLKQMGLREQLWFRVRLQYARLSFWPIIGFIVAAISAGVTVWAARSEWLGVNVAPWLGTTTIFGVGIAASASKAVGWLSNFVRSMTSKSKAAQETDSLGVTTEADREIKRLLRVLSDNHRNAVAIFVDDLDRCSPGSVAEVTETINQIFNSDEEDALGNSGGRNPPGACLFVLGMDREVVAAAIEVKYQGLVQRLKDRESQLGDGFGDRFLEKIVQFTVCVPEIPRNQLTHCFDRLFDDGTDQESPRPSEKSISEAERFIRAENPRNPGDVPIDNVTRRFKAQPGVAEEAIRRVRESLISLDSKDVREAEKEVLALLPPNPRQIKRFDNAFRLQLNVLNRIRTADPQFKPASLRAIARLVALRLWWPDIAVKIDQDDNVLTELEKAASLSEPEPAYAAWLEREGLKALLTMTDAHADGTSALVDLGRLRVV